MKDLVNFMRSNAKQLMTAYFTLSIVAICWLSWRLASHECKKTKIQINETYKQKMDEINNAHDPDVIDSLLRELYGFGSK